MKKLLTVLNVALSSSFFTLALFPASALALFAASAAWPTNSFAETSSSATSLATSSRPSKTSTAKHTQAIKNSSSTTTMPHAQAGKTTSQTQAQNEKITIRQSAPDYGSRKGDPSLAVGFATFTAPGILDFPSITALLKLDSLNSLHAFVSLPKSSAFNIGGMVLYKRTVLENQNSGFHLGGGFGLASTNDVLATFAFNLALVAGFHFTIPSVPNIEVHLDGGPNFSLINTSPEATRQFSILPFSTALGLSVVYYI